MNGQKTKLGESIQKKCLIFLLLTAGGIVLDQITKMLAVKHLSGGKDIWLIRDVLCLTYAANEGAAFSMMWGKRFFLLVFTSIIIAVIYLYAFHLIRRQGRLFPVILTGLTAAGATGNLIDRIFRGYVVDFIYFAPIDFPVFNAADIMVVCGCIGLIILTILTGDELKERE